MTGRVLRATRSGFQAELVVQCFLNALALTTPIRIQDDIGVDFDCVLLEPKEDMLYSGPSFTVQAKRNATTLRYTNPHEIAWLVTHASPLFFAVQTGNLTVDLYSVWRRKPASLRFGTERGMTFLVGPPPDQVTWIDASSQSSELKVYLGPPVVSATLTEVLDPATAEDLRKKLRHWIQIDLENIVCSGAGMHWTVDPEGGRAEFFYSAHNVEKCERNLRRAAVAMRLTHAVARSRGAPCLDAARVDGVDGLLLAWADHLEPELKDELRRVAGLEL
jgi:hypothetical protein